jgi:two-component system, OmpR family, phosphate regulon sensor histidine kinase PhoR
MFRRLATVYILLLLGAFALLGVALALSVEPPLRARLLLVVAAGAGLTMAAALACSAWLARQVARPLEDLTKAAEYLGGGAGAPRVLPEREDEVGELGRTFNRMSARLAQRITRLEADRQQLTAILGGMVEGVVALDAGQRIVFANERAVQLLEMPAGACVGRRLWEVVRQRPLLDVVQRALASTEPRREELSWSGAAARSLTVHAASLPGAEPHRGVRGAVLVLHDTSELRRLERLRQEFVANVSHELKTPLSVIQACVETLLDGAAEDAGHRTHFLEQIAGQADRLHALILDLLSLARIESGDELFDFQAVPVGDVVRAAVERHRPRAEARRQRLVVAGAAQEKTGNGNGSGHGNAGRGEAVPVPLPVPVPDAFSPAQAEDVAVWADEEAVETVLENLLDNALKYTPDGGEVRVGWQARDGQVLLEVSDTGIGIPEADLPRIFERFYRVDKARSREMGGTGLGLSIVKHLTQAMRGSVRAASRVGHGTTFIVSLPQALPP